MLDVITDFEFSNVASQLAIQVLDFLKTSFDEADLENLKTFVKTQLSNNEKAYLRFPGAQRTATRGHLAAVIKIALVLKKLTLEGGMLALGGAKKRTGEEDQEQIEREE